VSTTDKQGTNRRFLSTASRRVRHAASRHNTVISSNTLPASSSCEEKEEGGHISLKDSTTYPSGLLKGDLPKPRTRKPWYADSALDCITKNNQATESAIYIERGTGFGIQDGDSQRESCQEKGFK
jgi:hypothetical protein